MYRAQKTPVEKDIEEVLSVAKCLKEVQLISYLLKIHPEKNEKYIEKQIKKELETRRIYSVINGYLSSFPEDKPSACTIQFFWLYLEMLDDKKLHFDEGRYPADYIVEMDNHIFEIIIYSENGDYKLNYLNHRKEYDKETIMLILLNDMREEDIPNSLSPREAHQFITFTYKLPNLPPNISYGKFHQKAE